MIATVFAPQRLSRQPDTGLAPSEAPQLQRIELRQWVGRVRRGPGHSKAQDVTGSTLTVLGCGAWQQRGCRRWLVAGDGSNVKAHPGVQRYTAGATQTPIYPNCSGPLPEANDNTGGGGEFDGGGGEDGNGVPPAGAPGGWGGWPGGGGPQFGPSGGTSCIAPFTGMYGDEPTLAEAQAKYAVGTVMEQVCTRCPSGYAYWRIAAATYGGGGGSYFANITSWAFVDCQDVGCC